MKRLKNIIVSMLIAVCMMVGYAPTIIHAATEEKVDVWANLPSTLEVSNNALYLYEQKGFYSKTIQAYVFEKEVYDGGVRVSKRLIAETDCMNFKYENNNYVGTDSIPLKKVNNNGPIYLFSEYEEPKIQYEMTIRNDMGDEFSYVVMRTNLNETPNFGGYGDLIDLKFKTNKPSGSSYITGASLKIGDLASDRYANITKLQSYKCNTMITFPVALFEGSEYTRLIETPNNFVNYFFGHFMNIHIEVGIGYEIGGEYYSDTVGGNENVVDIQYNPQMNGTHVEAINIKTNIKQSVYIVENTITVDGRVMDGRNILYSPYITNGLNHIYSSNKYNAGKSNRTLYAGTYSVSAYGSHRIKSGPTTVNVTGDSFGELYYDLTAGADLVGTVVDGAGKSPDRAKVSLVKINGSTKQYITTADAGVDGYAIIGAISEAGTYQISVDGVRKANGLWEEYTSTPVQFEVTSADIASGRISKDITYVAGSSKPSDVVSGTVKTATTQVKDGSLVNITVDYKNNSTSSINADFSATVPTGMTLIMPIKNYTIPAGASGSFNFSVKVTSITSPYVTVPVKVSYGGKTCDFGSIVLEKQAVTLNAPQSVQTGSKYKVYGEVNDGATVQIIDYTTDTVLADNITASGKWFSAELTAVAGTTTLAARIKDTTVTSKTVKVSSYTDIPNVLTVEGASHTLPTNSKLGIPAFHAWTDDKLNGKEFSLATTYDKAVTKVVYSFSGKTYNATNVDGSWTAQIGGWAGAGIKPITVTIDDTYTYTIAEVTVLVDPSGIVTDAETGLPIIDATMTCEESKDDGETWTIWNGEDYGYTNPMQTDKEGWYGWDVPEGLYRVKATKIGYKDYVTTEDPSIPPIKVPVPRTDVNIAMEPNVRMESITLDETATMTLAETTKTLTPVITPLDATNKDKIKWTSNNTDVATVDANGVVTALTDGTVDITVTFERKDQQPLTATCTLQVGETVVEEKNTIELVVENNAQNILTATGVVNFKELDSLADVQIYGAFFKDGMITQIVMPEINEMVFTFPIASENVGSELKVFAWDKQTQQPYTLKVNTAIIE